MKFFFEFLSLMFFSDDPLDNDTDGSGPRGVGGPCSKCLLRDSELISDGDWRPFSEAEEVLRLFEGRDSVSV